MSRPSNACRGCRDVARNVSETGLSNPGDVACNVSTSITNGTDAHICRDVARNVSETGLSSLGDVACYVSTDTNVNDRVAEPPTLYKSKYRVESTRLKDWDYRSEGLYFITICTHNAFEFLGHIENNQMHLSEIGNLVNCLVTGIPVHAPNAIIDNHVVMPNHIHILLALTDKSKSSPCRDVARNVSEPASSPRRDVACNVSTNEGDTMSSISPKSGSVATIIRSFKSAVTKQANQSHIPFKWQSRFHDHIVRDERAYEQIWNYIDENPIRWKEDILNPSHPKFSEKILLDMSSRQRGAERGDVACYVSTYEANNE